MNVQEAAARTGLSMDLIAEIVRALEEDIGPGDVTTNSVVPEDAVMTGHIIARSAGVVAGLDAAHATCLLLDLRVRFVAHVAESARVQPRQALATVSGPARALLTAERTALNILGRISGIATLTRRYADAVSGTHAVVIDTRKTAPGCRALDKLAVRRGGGQNHRMGLYDMVLIKDNHIDFSGSLAEAARRARLANTGLLISIEARTLDDVAQALDLGITRIMLDNMSLEAMRQAVILTAGRAQLEASGNVNLETVRQVAETGVDLISVGALTHSMQALNVAFDWVPPGAPLPGPGGGAA